MPLKPTIALFALLLPLGASAQTVVPKLDQEGRKGDIARMVHDKAAAQFDTADGDKDNRLTREEADHYLRNRAAKGFTVVQAVALSENDGLLTPNAYAERPLTDNDPCRPNEAYFAHVDRVIDRAAELCFLAAILSVATYLLLEAGAALGMIDASVPYALAKLFTVLGVAFPTLGSTLAGIRYFGDFERFSVISKVTASKLTDVEHRISLLLSGDPLRLTYRAVSKVVQGVDEIVIAEIESWQAVFGAKHLALPA